MGSTGLTRQPIGLALGAVMLLAVGGCASSSTSGGAASSGAAPAPSAAASSATTPRAAGGNGTARLAVTGTVTLTLNGTGASCTPYLQGVAYQVSSTTSTNAQTSLGRWDLTVSDDAANGHVIALFNTDAGNFSGGYSVNDPNNHNLVAQLDRHHASLDTDLKKVLGQEKIHMVGSIDCP